MERRFRACAPNRLHVADITYARMADGRFAYTAFVTDVYARRIVGWACATSMGTRELATFQWVSWWNTKRLHASLDYKTPQQVENEYYEHQTAQAASL